MLLASFSSFRIHSCSTKSFNGIWPSRAESKSLKSSFRPKTCGGSAAGTAVVSNKDDRSLSLRTFAGNEIVVDDSRVEVDEVSELEIRKRVNAIRRMLRSKDDGESSISCSAYHTAWVALLEHVDGSGAPQFPSSLEWIANNQLPDGSWGDPGVFLSYDRLLCTLASVIALRFWDVYPEKSQRGIKFFSENVSKLEKENREHMTCGFEIIFPTLLRMARSLNIELPDDFPAMKEISNQRNEKLKRIPSEAMHGKPTSLLFSLEAFTKLEWEKLLKFQSQDGSFLFCPSSTAFAFMQTKDQNCLNYLNKVVQRFNGGVPDFYPIDFFEQIWVVDRLERLGIARYFEPEIKEIVNYVYRYWNKNGIGWTRYSDLPDLDDTAMGFRLLRLHGLQVSAKRVVMETSQTNANVEYYFWSDAFQHFEKGGEFFCMAGQSTQGVTVMFNLYRTSQLLFPGEKILEDAKQFSFKFLSEKCSANKLVDKWIITKDLFGEVSFALDIPWYAMLPRIETRFYLEHYGGENDVWISKTLYRLHKVSNNIYHELGKLDYNNCQAVHLMEWESIEEWYSEAGLKRLKLSRERLLLSYFLAAASIFEVEKSQERLAWIKTAALIEVITTTCEDEQQRRAFVHEFANIISPQNYFNQRKLNTNKITNELVEILVGTLHHFSMSSPTVQFEVLHDVWKTWLLRWQSEGNECQGEAELLVKIINLNAGYMLPQDLELNPQYQQLIQLTNKLCYQLRCLQEKKELCPIGSYTGNDKTSNNSTPEMELKMQELVQLVLQNSSNNIDSNIKKTFLTVTKTFYYAAYCDPNTVNSHIIKVLLERVI